MKPGRPPDGGHLMLMDSDQKQPLYGLIGILVILFGSTVAALLYFGS
jgi:hypothetical protein